MNQFHLNIHPSLKDFSEGYSEKILIVEDDEAYLDLLCHFLIKGDYDFSVAQNGKDAITSLKKNDFGVVITDIKMPVIDGMQLLAHIKKTYPFIDVVVLTGFNKDYTFSNVISAGASDFMVKTVSRDEFLAKIQRVFRERRLIREYNRHKSNLERVNTALSVLLEKRGKDKLILEEQVLAQVEHLVRPYLKNLEISGLSVEQKVLLEILEESIDEIVSPFAHTLSGLKLKLTPTEIQVADMVRQGMSSKEIAEIMYLSPNTISNHRKNIRKKCGLSSNNDNLRSFLLSRMG